MHPNYLPFAQRVPDTQLQDTIRRVKEEGIQSKTQQGDDTFSLPFAVTHVHDLKNGFPWETARSIKISGFMAINEMAFFLNGGDQNEVLNTEFGVPFWDDTFIDAKKCEKRGLPANNLGSASYGPVLHDFPKRHGGAFNQIQAIVDQIRELPHLKTHIATTLYPPEIFRGVGKEQKVVTVPCHGSLIYFTVLGDKLHMQMVQRSGDLIPGVPHNKIQYAALFLAVAQATKYEPSIFTHTILNPHIYASQLKQGFVDLILERKARPYPTVLINDESIMDVFAFRKEHFSLTDYKPHPSISNIPVAS